MGIMSSTLALKECRAESRACGADERKLNPFDTTNIHPHSWYAPSTYPPPLAVIPSLPTTKTCLFMEEVVENQNIVIREKKHLGYSGLDYLPQLDATARVFSRLKLWWHKLNWWSPTVLTIVSEHVQMWPHRSQWISYCKLYTTTSTWLMKYLWYSSS